MCELLSNVVVSVPPQPEREILWRAAPPQLIATMRRCGGRARWQTKRFSLCALGIMGVLGIVRENSHTHVCV